MIVLISILAVVVNAEYTRLEVKNCNTNVNSPASITNMAVTPMPAVLPGDIYFSADMKLTRPVGASSLSLSIKRKGYWFDIPIPCILRVGSCTYNNVCTMVDEMINENWAGIMNSVGTQIRDMMQSNGIAYNQCPQQPRSLSIRNYLIHMPEIPRVLSWFAEGDYSARVVMTEHATGDQLICLDLNLSLRKACSGIRCFFGK